MDSGSCYLDQISWRYGDNKLVSWDVSVTMGREGVPLGSVDIPLTQENFQSDLEVMVMSENIYRIYPNL